MPFTYEIDPAERLVRIDAEGDVSVDSWFAMIDDVRADERFTLGFDLLFDRTKLGHVPDAVYVREWIDRLRPVMREMNARHLAIVVTEPVVYGMMRMASAFAYRGGFSLDPYWSVEEALAALGRPSA